MSLGTQPRGSGVRASQAGLRGGFPRGRQSWRWRWGHSWTRGRRRQPLHPQVPPVAAGAEPGPVCAALCAPRGGPPGGGPPVTWRRGEEPPEAGQCHRPRRVPRPRRGNPNGPLPCPPCPRPGPPTGWGRSHREADIRAAGGGGRRREGRAAHRRPHAQSRAAAGGRGGGRSGRSPGGCSVRRSWGRRAASIAAACGAGADGRTGGRTDRRAGRRAGCSLELRSACGAGRAGRRRGMSELRPRRPGREEEGGADPRSTGPRCGGGRSGFLVLTVCVSL